MITIICLEDGRKLEFMALTPYEAMIKCKYYLDLNKKDNNAKINKTISGLHLWMEHNGRTYSVKNF